MNLLTSVISIIIETMNKYISIGLLVTRFWSIYINLYIIRALKHKRSLILYQFVQLFLVTIDCYLYNSLVSKSILMKFQHNTRILKTLQLTHGKYQICKFGSFYYNQINKYKCFSLQKKTTHYLALTGYIDTETQQTTGRNILQLSTIGRHRHQHRLPLRRWPQLRQRRRRRWRRRRWTRAQARR